MSNNSNYPFGIDLYEGNRIKDWEILTAWDLHPVFCYFRLGIGVHYDDLHNLTECARVTNWHLGGYYQVWLPEVSIARQCDTIQKSLDTFNPAYPGRLDLPLALAFEPETNSTTGSREFPRWSDTLGIKAHFEALGLEVLIYTSLSGLDEIKRQGEKNLNAYKWWIARYTTDQAVNGEMSVINTMSVLLNMYNLDMQNVYFMQTASQLTYPPGSVTDKEADYDRAVSWVFEDMPNPIPEPIPDPGSGGENLLQTFKLKNAANGLNIREGEGLNTPIVGGLFPPSTIQGIDLGNGWVELHGYASSDYLEPLNPPAPIPDPTPAPGGQLWVLRGDEELGWYLGTNFNYRSRTAGRSYSWTPSVFRFEKTVRDPKSDYRVDISTLLSAYIAINGQTQKDSQPLNYLFSDKTALYNGTGYPKQAYITMSGNIFEEIGIEGNYLKFKTLKPSSNVSGMTPETHPQFIHHFDLVGWVDKTTKHKSIIKPEIPILYYYLVTNEGYGYIPLAAVRPKV